MMAMVISHSNHLFFLLLFSLISYMTSSVDELLVQKVGRM